MMRLMTIAIASLSVFAIAASAQEEARTLVVPVGKVNHRPIDEISGMVKSERYPGVYWVHNDSGDSSRLFSISRTGEVIFPDWTRSQFFVGEAQEGKREWPGLQIQLAVNNDWEDIALFGEYIVIADAGNNGNVRRDLGLYFVAEPNPHQVMSARILKYLPIRYPDQHEYPAELWHFDSEALFTADDKLYLITKHRKPGEPAAWEEGAVLYRLDTEFIDRENVLTRVDEHPSIRLATAADLSPDGMHLAVLSYSAVWVFDRPGEGDRWLSASARSLALNFFATGQVESICWVDDETMLISNEPGDLYEIRLGDLTPVKSAEGS